MITRRSFLASATAISAAELANQGTFSKLAAAVTGTASPNQAQGLTRFVNPLIGTGAHGHTHPAATVPFGMVQLGPDTHNYDWDHCSGYHYTDSSIMGFSHTHLSGTGCGDMLDFLLMPGAGPAKTEPGSPEHPEQGYRSRFSHSDEIAQPGYYSVLLKDYGIRAELTATERAGIHRYTFPQSDSSHFIFDLTHMRGQDTASINWANLQLSGNNTILGGRSTNAWARDRQLYYAIQFSRPFEKVEILADGVALPASVRQSSSKSIKLLIHYPTKAGEVIFVKTGISGVSAEAALKNLTAEIPAWDFDAVRSQATTAWERELSAIHITGASLKQQQIFYTGLYHALVAPCLFDDVDGQYRGVDGKVHQLSPGEHNYSCFSIWDTYRAVHPLFTLIQSERVPIMMRCLVRMAEELPAGLPTWPVHGVDTGCMGGYAVAAVLAEAQLKGFTGIDYNRAWQLARKRALGDPTMDVYHTLGYFPSDKEPESVSRTLDSAYCDWAVAHLARAAGATEDADRLVGYAANYRNFFDKSTGFMRPRNADGSWPQPFAPNEMGHLNKWRDYTESNPWVTTFSVPQDPKGLALLMGGPQTFVAKLDDLFTASSAMPSDAAIDISGFYGQYAQGNEPSHHIAYLYNYAGAPWKTQQRVRDIMENLYSNTPEGLPGNDDCGQMSAWYILSALGFYPVDPVTANYVLGAPLFEKVSVRLGKGRELVIEAKPAPAPGPWVQSIQINGQPHTRSWFRHADIANGGTLAFTMASEPNKSFGANPAEAPPSMTA